MSALDNVLGRLEGVRKTGDGHQAKCPAHEDRHASLSIGVGDDGRVLLNCHANCATADVVAAIGLELGDLFERDESNGRDSIVVTYDYEDEHGALLYQVVRKANKKFVQRRPDGRGDWIWKIGNTRRVLYRLPRVLEGVADGATVYVAEGEKDVGALEAAGVVATCNPMGAGKWRALYAKPLRGADVVVVADKDEPGREHAAEVAASLADVAKSVRIVEAADGKDAADHLAAGHTVDEFIPVSQQEEPESRKTSGDTAPEKISMDGRVHLREIGLAQVVQAFREELHLPDARALRAVLATAIANRMAEGDPVWLIVVAGSSRGKTELVTPLDALPEVYVTGKLTEASLLSGTSRQERAANAKGGLLREIGDRGTLVVKDMGAILSLHRDSRAEVLQAPREVYDGLYTRDVGTDGGKRLRWEGSIGLIAAGTTALDSAHAVVSALGERWLTIRLPETGRDQIGRMALGHSGTAEMRTRLREVVSSFIERIDPPELVRLDLEDEDLVVAVSNLATLARSPVDRDGYSREIVLVHDSEGPARFARQLHKLTCAFGAMGMDRPEIRDLLVKIGYDSIPSPRREVLMHLLGVVGWTRTADIATGVSLPTRSVERACEELTAHGLLNRSKSGSGDKAANVWAPSDEAKRLYQAISGSPDLSGGGRSDNTNTALVDISGDAPAASEPPPWGDDDVADILAGLEGEDEPHQEEFDLSDIYDAAVELQHETGTYAHPSADVTARAKRDRAKRRREGDE